ncbi:MAG: DUF2237 domain-containing protein [Fibrobacterales bacterium]
MALNVLGTNLESCSIDPMTGFFRTGCCDTSYDDAGMHTVCVQVDEDFLTFSASVGNDLSTPVPGWQFQGLKSGDRWCLCLQRWVEAFNAGRAPLVYLEGTHISALEFVDLKTLQAYTVNQ